MHSVWVTAKDQAKANQPVDGESTPRTAPVGGTEPTAQKPATEPTAAGGKPSAASKDSEPVKEGATDKDSTTDKAATAPEPADVLVSATEESSRRRRWKRRAVAAALPSGSRWNRWYWVLARGFATAIIGVLAILLGTLVLPKFLDAETSADRAPDPTPSASAPADTGQAPGLPASPLPSPSGTLPPSPAGPVQTQPGRPADALSAWAVNLNKLGIPQVALQAYGYAQTVLASTQPGCNLSWTLLAGIGSVESNHGRHGGATLLADGNSQPKIVGIQLDGSASQRIPDTDQGKLDGDPNFDRAMGAMQFIPSAWKKWAIDADNDGKADPYDLDDAALGSAYYLCAGGRDLSTGTGWWSAVLSYNNLERYAGDVYRAADRYGQDSTTVN